MSFIEKLLLVSFLLLTPAVFSVAQSPPERAPVSLLVNVLDRDGNAVRDLKKDNFRVKVNGHWIAPVDAHYGVAPRRIVVLLDMSGSMAGAAENQYNKWRIARQALETLTKEIPAGTQLALITFSSRVNDVVDFSGGKAEIGDWLKRETSQAASVKGVTALFDAASRAAKLLQPSQPGDAIYAITDAGDNRSRTSAKDLRKQLLRSEIRLFLFLFDEPQFLDPRSEEKYAVVSLARETGGFIFDVTGREQVLLPPWQSAYDDNDKTRRGVELYTRELSIQVNGFYTLRLPIPLEPGKSRKVSIEIVDAGGKTIKGLASLYPKTILMPVD